MTRITVALMALLLTQMTWGEVNVRTGPHDKRVVTFQYQENEVYTINAHYNQETVVRFHEDEFFIWTGAGDTEGWTVDQHEHMLFLKPVANDADTNMNVVTQDRATNELRYYTFELNALTAGSNEVGTWSIEMRDSRRARRNNLANIRRNEATQKTADEAATLPIVVRDMDFNYRGNGDRALAPQKMFDDGKFTYFQFAPQQTLPAITAIEGNKQQLIVNRHQEGVYTVVHQTADEFLLRLNDQQLLISYQGKR